MKKSQKKTRLTFCIAFLCYTEAKIQQKWINIAETTKMMVEKIPDIFNNLHAFLIPRRFEFEKKKEPDDIASWLKKWEKKGEKTQSEWNSWKSKRRWNIYERRNSIEKKGKFAHSSLSSCSFFRLHSISQVYFFENVLRFLLLFRELQWGSEMCLWNLSVLDVCLLVCWKMFASFPEKQPEGTSNIKMKKEQAQHVNTRRNDLLRLMRSWCLRLHSPMMDTSSQRKREEQQDKMRKIRYVFTLIRLSSKHQIFSCFFIPKDDIYDTWSE